MLDTIYLPSCLIFLRALESKEYYIYFSVKMVEVQGNLSNVIEGVSGSPRILIYIDLNSLCLT